MSAQGDVSRLITLEVDLAFSSKAASERIAYTPFPYSPQSANLGLHGEYYASFGLQAPDRRPVLVVLAGDRRETSLSRYGLHEPVRWRDVSLVQADAVEIAVLRDAASRGVLLVDKAGQLLIQFGDPVDTLTAAVVKNLNTTRRCLYIPRGHFDLRNGDKPGEQPVDLIIPVAGEAGLMSGLRDVSAAFTAGFFILAEEEVLADPYTKVMDPIGLIIADGVVQNPPLFKRPAIVFVHRHGQGAADSSLLNTLQEVAVLSLGMEDVRVVLPGGVSLTAAGEDDEWRGMSGGFTLNSQLDHSHSVIWTPTREFSPEFQTPLHDDALDVLVVGCSVVGIHKGGGSGLPVNGYVVQLYGRLADLVQSAVVLGDISISYNLVHPILTASNGMVSSAVQGWVQLIRNGKLLDMQQEVSKHQIGGLEYGELGHALPPIYLVNRYLNQEDRAHTVVGITSRHKIIVTYVEAVEARSYQRGRDSVGASLLTLAEHLKTLGCLDAIALDGGGSANLLVENALLGAPADRFDIAGLPRERLTAGVFTVA